MAQIIIGKANTYNIFSTITDSPVFESALTLDQLKYYINEELGRKGIADLEKRLDRVNKKGTSSMLSKSLEDEVGVFLECEKITLLEFIEKYLKVKNKL